MKKVNLHVVKTDSGYDVYSYDVKLCSYPDKRSAQRRIVELTSPFEL